MNCLKAVAMIFALLLGLLELACKQAESDPKAEAPPPLKVQSVVDRNVFEVDRPERFPLTMSVAHTARPDLNVTGTVNPDVSRNASRRGLTGSGARSGPMRPGVPASPPTRCAIS